MEFNALYEILKSVGEKSSTLTTWSLSMLGGSLLTIISSSYIKPSNIKYKLFYLIFIPGWLFLSFSIFYGVDINRRLIAASIATVCKNETALISINENINTDFLKQINSFQYAVLAFAIWLILYVVWFIFRYNKNLE